MLLRVAVTVCWCVDVFGVLLFWRIGVFGGVMFGCNVRVLMC